jgi:hypothetical protein
MRIKEIKYQHRRDFTAIYECEHCSQSQENEGYDDSNFHQNVIPDMECTGCGKKSPENYRPLASRHSDRVVI